MGSAPGNIGQCFFARSHTVITYSTWAFSNSEISFEICFDISIPISGMTSTLRGCRPFGWVPALKTSKCSPAMCRNNPSAIWLLAELPVHKNKTRLLDFINGRPFQMLHYQIPFDRWYRGQK